jgi:hypothetical protein
LAVTISLAALFGILLFFAIRSGRATVSTAICAVLFGFCLASTGLAPAISGLLTAVQTTADQTTTHHH